MRYCRTLKPITIIFPRKAFTHQEDDILIQAPCGLYSLAKCCAEVQEHLKAIEGLKFHIINAIDQAEADTSKFDEDHSFDHSFDMRSLDLAAYEASRLRAMATCVENIDTDCSSIEKVRELAEYCIDLIDAGRVEYEDSINGPDEEQDI